MGRGLSTGENYPGAMSSFPSPAMGELLVALLANSGIAENLCKTSICYKLSNNMGERIAPDMWKEVLYEVSALKGHICLFWTFLIPRHVC